MYIPKRYELSDKEQIVSFMKKFSFATIVTIQNNIPIATHLPFVISYDNNNIILTSHFSKANNQWRDIENKKVLVIFSEPHAYISPKLYDSLQNVPTWNYLAVHTYGEAKIISEKSKVVELLEYTIDNFEKDYKQQWNKLSDEYKSNMLGGIVAFTILITDIQAKKKLSQNKTEKEQLEIINSFEKSSDPNKQLIAQYMKDLKKE